MTDCPETSGFYFDPEILGRRPPTPERQPIRESPNLFDYLQGPSASPATFSPAFDAGASPPSTPPRSLPDIETARQQPCVLLMGGVVRSEQVGVFWERYNAYPRYLKNFTKRKKRKSQKPTIGSVENGAHAFVIKG
jgi:hypothetical protein